MRRSGRNPTRNQKEIISKSSLNVENWLVQREDDRYLYLKHRISGNEKKIVKKSR